MAKCAGEFWLIGNMARYTASIGVFSFQQSQRLHQDTSFLDFIDPPSSITCWVTLDDTHRDAGTLEYAPGSHKWPLTRLPDEASR
jgi:ectoine hydroxylase-related dioxygenase (phytanoyl-CoA dioxygenase family)